MSKIIGLVTFRVFPTHMGGQKGVALFYQYLQQHHEVLLAASEDNVATDKVEMRKVLLPNKKIYKNLSRMRLLAEVASLQPAEIIIAEHSYAGWLAWMLQKRKRIPFIIHSHNIESKRFQKMGKKWWPAYYGYEGWIHRKAAFNFFISQEDLDFAVSNFKLEEKKCAVITYGVERVPVHPDKSALRRKLGLPEDEKLLLFNGTLDYEPNHEAVITLIEKLIPLMDQKLDRYKIIITGNRAPRSLAEKMLAAQKIEYLGYVEDVNLYYQSADLFINPVANDTGVKTKLIEALANHCTTVSTIEGASGIRKELCGEKLVLVGDGDWNAFADGIFRMLHQKTGETPDAFFRHYSWETIALSAARKIEEVIQSGQSK